MTAKEQLWKKYYELIRIGRRQEAQDVLRKIHAMPTQRRQTGGCSRCRKRF